MTARKKSRPVEQDRAPLIESFQHPRLKERREGNISGGGGGNKKVGTFSLDEHLFRAVGIVLGTEKMGTFKRAAGFSVQG